MAKAFAELIVEIVEDSLVLDPDPDGDGTGSNCELDWAIEEEDNGNPDCYLVGTAYFARLYESPLGMNVETYNSNGTIYYVSEQNPEIPEEYIIFDNSDNADFKIPYWSDFTYEQIGTAFDYNGDRLQTLKINIAKGSSKIKASEKCFAIFRVSYTGVYSRYRFTGKSEDKLFLLAFTTCSDELVYATTTVDILEDCSTAKLEEVDCLEIQAEVDNDSELGARLANEGIILVRIYGPESSLDILVGVTLGAATFIGQSEEEFEEEIYIEDGKGQTAHPIDVLKEWKKTSGNFERLEVVDKQLEVTQQSADNLEADLMAVGGVPYGYGTANVTYISKFLQYQISSERFGKGLMIIQDLTHDQCDNKVTLQYEIRDAQAVDEEKITALSIMAEYVDFVTGEPIPGARVWLEGQAVGRTDSDGKILLKGIKPDVKYRIKASKPGYLNTDSDSLSNDEFVVRAAS